MVKLKDMIQKNNILKSLNIKHDFPFYRFKPDAIFFDNAATSQKPDLVINRINSEYNYGVGNVARSTHKLSDHALEVSLEARAIVQDFIHAKDIKEIVFNSGTTEGINSLAYGLENYLTPGQEILLSEIEHTSNTFPWIQLAQRRGLNLKFINVLKDGHLDDVENYLTPQTSLVSISMCSHVTGIVTPIRSIIQKIRNYNPSILVAVDCAQAVTHLDIDVQALDCDFLAFSGHKVLGPNGIGVLYVHERNHHKLGCFKFGGGMIDTLEQMYDPQKINFPRKMEAGTLNYIGAIGLAEGMRYLRNISNSKLEKLYRGLNSTLRKLLQEKFPQINFVGEESSAICSFYFPEYHSHDLGILLDQKNIYIRTGVLCSGHLLQALKLPPLMRISFGPYNEHKELKVFMKALDWAIQVIKK